MSSGYDEGADDAWLDDADDAFDEGFYRGRVAAESRTCCPHQPDCVMAVRPSWWRRVLFRGGAR